MSTEMKNAVPVPEIELTDSDDDGFEVLDPEPEQETDDFKYLSRNDFTNAGTIIFCHMHDEYNSIQQVRCQYIRPEGWKEQEKDEIAIFEVGWINTEEAVAKLPADRYFPEGFPLGFVDLKEFAFAKEQYAACPGEVSHFQLCYLRDGVLLGASTPFGIRGIKAVSRLSLMGGGGKPLFLPCREIAADGGIATKQSLSQLNNLPADGLDVFQLLGVKVPSLKHNHDKVDAEKQLVHDDESNASPGVEISALQSSLRHLTVLTKKLQNEKCNAKSRTSECTTEMIVGLTQSIDELMAEMQKARKGFPSNASMISASSPESCDDLEQRFRSCAAQLKANLQDCTRTFDLCKVAIKNQTPPSSLSEIEKSDHLRIGKTEWKQQQELEELQERLKKAEGEIEKLREELSLKENERRELSEHLENVESQKITIGAVNNELSVSLGEVKKQLFDKETELKQVKDELSIKDTDLWKSKEMLCSVETKLRVVSQELLQKENECRELKKSGEDFRLRKEGMDIFWKQEMKDQLETMEKKLEDVNDILTLKEATHRNYVAHVNSERGEMEAKLRAISDDCGGLRSQITTLQEEAKLYKSKLGETIVELANSRRETDDLKEQCQKFVKDMNFLESENNRLLGCIDTLKEKLEVKRPDPADPKHDVLIQEFLKKSEELLVAKQQVDDFQQELFRLNVQRTTLQKELLEARQNPAPCHKPCCTFEIEPGQRHTDHVVESILEALEQSLQENKRLQSELETEKMRLQSMDEKLQSAAGIQRGLYMEKITLESRLNELLGRD